MQRRLTLLALGVILFLDSSIQAQIVYYRIQRQQWNSQIATNPVPLMYRFSSLVAGNGIQQATIASPSITNTMTGGTYQMTYATNYYAAAFVDTNLNNGFTEFIATYPTGAYRLNATYKLGPITTPKTYNLALTNDFSAVAPVFTNILPYMDLKPVQVFSWPVFSTDTNNLAQFYLLEGHLETNILQSIITNGIDSVTNELSVLAYERKLLPGQNSITVTNINPSLDHLAILEFHMCNPTVDDPLRQSEVSSVSANGAFYFALRIVGSPSDQVVEVGDFTTLSVFAVGSRPLYYQWYHENTPISYGTNTVLLLTDVKYSDAGRYYAVVSNITGSVTSAPAMLTVTNATPPGELKLIDYTIQPNQTFRALVSNMSSNLYSVWASTNFTNWSLVGYVTNTLGSGYIFDTNASGQKVRFYRAKSEN